MGEFVYGGIDGSVIIFVVVVGFVGVGLDSFVIFILGFVNLLVDGFFMFVGVYFLVKLELYNYEKYKKVEYWEIEYKLEEEWEEVWEIYC